jgi:putative hydrolase of the HAD superfamily
VSEAPSGLLLDFGSVCLKSPFELLDRYEERIGLAPGTLAWRGPFDVEGDPLWSEVSAGRRSEREYWQQRASQVEAIPGSPGGVRELMQAVFQGAEDDVMRPEARALVRDATAADLRVAVLSNDLRAFHGEAWAASMSLLHEVDFVLDASDDHVPLKPDPRAYQLALERMDLRPEQVLFVDDQDVNVQGAIAVGMVAVRFDVTDIEASFAQVRRLLSLDKGAR